MSPCPQDLQGLQTPHVPHLPLPSALPMGAIGNFSQITLGPGGLYCAFYNAKDISGFYPLDACGNSHLKS